MDPWQSSEDYYDDLKKELESPMPWIGMYIAAASAACGVAMAIDTINAFRSKKLWVPCKYFSLNAFSLTVLAIALKIPVDLTSEMEGRNDRLVRVSSLVLMSTVMSNFITSLGNIETKLNLAALGILVITVVANVCIRLTQSQRYYFNRELQVDLPSLVSEIVCIVDLLFLLVILCATAVMVPTAKTYLELQYNQMHKRISNDEQLVNGRGRFTITTDELRVKVRRYWVMAETGSPQFVIAGSVTCVASSLMCLFMALTLLQAYFSMPHFYKFERQSTSSFKWSIKWILVIQSIGVALGTIAPLLRWFAAARLKSTNLGQKSFKDELKVEAYWTQKLKHWRDSPLPLKNRHLKFRKVVHDAKRLFLNFCIGSEVLIVWASKLVLLVSAFFVKGILFLLTLVKRLLLLEARDSREWAFVSNDFSPYVLRLEGEVELPERTLKNIYKEVDKLIGMGREKQSKNIIKLLQKSVNFNGVREFDSRAIRSLSSQEPPNCWSLPIVTLTSIAISLPNVTGQKSDQLLSVVGEGLYFAKIVDKTSDTNGELTSIINAADVVWVGVELYRKWQDTDLKAAGQTQKEKLNELSKIAEKIVADFTTDANNFLVQDPFNWPVQVIAANSMYRITQTRLLALDGDHSQTDSDELFERLSIMISDILVACLANLARVISLMCHSNAVKEREESISQAALLLGESEEILEILEHRELPNLDLGKVATIESWRAFMEQDNENPVSSVSEAFQQTNGVGHVSIELEG